MRDFPRQENVSEILQMRKRGIFAAKPGWLSGKLRMAKGMEARKIKRKKERLQGGRGPGRSRNLRSPLTPALHSYTRLFPNISRSKYL